MLLNLLLLQGCNFEPEKINYGEDKCAHCEMNIVESQFGTELITDKGRYYKFDSIECLAAYIIHNKLSKEDIHSLWVTDYNNTGNLMNAKNAYYLHSKNLRSPMGMYLSAYGDESSAIEQQKLKNGDLLRWDEVYQLVEKEWF